MIYHGPTSIFTTEIAEPPGPIGSSTAPMVTAEDTSSLYNPTICLSIALFYIWQYPQFMFIDCEAFIREFDTNPLDGEFCSLPLIYIISAIGSLMSQDPEIRAMSSSFADSAEAILTSRGLGTPRIASVQALLACAHYEVGRGNLSKGWLYSGALSRDSFSVFKIVPDNI